MPAPRGTVNGASTWLAICMLLACSGSAGAQDALRGKRLYHDVGRLSGAGVSCIDCHGGLPGALHGISKAASRPETINQAINTIGQMAPLRGRLSASDMADLAAYIATPGIDSPQLRLTTEGPGHSAYSAERLAFPPSPAGSTSPASTVRLTNDGALPLQLRFAPTLEGPHATQFAIVASDCRADMTLSAAQSCSLSVAFLPQGPAGLRTASVGVSHDWINGAVRIALIGRVAPASGTVR